MVFVWKKPERRPLWYRAFQVAAVLLTFMLTGGIVALSLRIDGPPSLSEYTRMMRVSPPDSARVLARYDEGGFRGTRFFLTLEMDRRDLAGFLQSSPFAEIPFDRETDQQFKYAGNLKTLKTAQVVLSKSEVLNIGVRTTNAERVTVYLVLNGGG